MDPSPVHIAAWLASLMFLVGMTNQVLKLVDRMKSHPPGNELQLTASQIAQRVSDLEELRESDRDEASERRRAIFNQMDKDRTAFHHEIKGAYDRIERTERDFQQAMRNLPNEIIATLRNTGAIQR